MKREIRIKTPPEKSVHELTRSLSISPVTATLLVNRGIDSLTAARSFLLDSLAHISPPSVIKDIGSAVERVGRAIEKKEKILVFGDYDADGITATALLVDFLQGTGADVAAHIPHRIMEGYGLQSDLITNGVVKPDTDLVITVDCGSTNRNAARSCQEAGIDLIITDHHQVSPPYPESLALLNPSRRDCLSGLGMLSGVGVAFYLVIALRSFLRDRGFWKNVPEPNLKQYCDLVAIGTVADIVPLVGENRIFTKTGLEILNDRPRPGIQALITAARIKKRPLTAEDIAYVLAPRINAAGRIDHGKIALELLLVTDPDQAGRIAGTLNKLNTRRQLLEEEISDEIERAITADPSMIHKKRTLVLAHHQWHPGIIGIVASRAMRNFFLPVALIALDGDLGVGSARSIPGVNLYEILSQCSDLFEDFGGHARAAGFKIKRDNISRFEKQFEYLVCQNTRPVDFVPLMEVDCPLPLDRVSEKLINEIESLQPFGEQNPEPLFMAKNVSVSKSFLINDRHRKMTLSRGRPGNGATINAILFNTPADHRETRFFHRIVFRLRRDTWNGKNTPQLVIEYAETAPA